MCALRGVTPGKCPGRFPSLRSEQGSVSLMPLCGYPLNVKGVTFMVTPFTYFTFLRTMPKFFGAFAIFFSFRLSLLEQPFFPAALALPAGPTEKAERPAALPQWTSAEADCRQQQCGWNGIRRICGIGESGPTRRFYEPKLRPDP